MYKYKFIYVPKRGSIREHRLVMEKHLGRKLDINEVVHHKDNNGRNNDLRNLELMSRSEHTRHHLLNGDIGWQSSDTEKYHSKNTVLPKNNKSGFLGVIESRNKRYRAIIRVFKESKNIGTFRDKSVAAHYRDSATRFYLSDDFYLNFPDQQLLPPMSVEALKIIKKLNGH